MKVRDIRQGHLVDAYTKWRANGSRQKAVSGRTVRHVHDLMRCVLNYGVRRDLVTRNVAALIAPEDLPKASKPEPKALDEAEVKRLLETARKPSGRSTKRGYLSAEPWFAPAVAFSVYTGARRGEVLAVQWSDLNLEAKVGDDPAVSRRDDGPPVASSRNRRTAKLGRLLSPAPFVDDLGGAPRAARQERKALGNALQDDDSCSLDRTARSPGLGTTRPQSKT